MIIVNIFYIITKHLKFVEYEINKRMISQLIITNLLTLCRSKKTWVSRVFDLFGCGNF